MTLTWIRALPAIALASLTVSAQTGTLKITSPAPDSIVSGAIRLEAAVTPEALIPAVQSVTFFVNGRLVCTAERPPFGCPWNPGDVVRGHHIRVVATMNDGRPRLIDNGEFVRGLRQQDFELFEDGVAQKVASFVNENAPLDLVLAVDISGSMESSLVQVKAAVKQLLSKLRNGDAATLVGFNDTFFIAAEREKDRATREKAVDLLSSWGGTALYDATVRTLEMVSREWGRKGVVIFSDGDDRHSLTRRETAMARVQSSDAMLYTVGFGGGATVPALRSSLEAYARSTGGRAFFPRTVKDLDGVFDEVVAELANQYVLSYSSTNLKVDNAYRKIRVQVRKGKYDVRARKGYYANGPQRAGR
jgi:Ca-activated chloride channel family protein